MPVGTGSIKRAAKSAETKSTAVKKPAAKKETPAKNSDVQKTYGINDELPFYLM